MTDDRQEPGALEVLLEEEVYPAEAVRRAAYEFTDRCSVYLKTAPDGLVAILTPTAGVDPQELRGAFLNAVLDHSLRRSIAIETEEVRRRIIAAALREAYRTED